MRLPVVSEPRRTKPTVWVVDDSPLERQAVARALGNDYSIEELSDGADVVERLAAFGASPPDVLLLDWVMPGMSGDEVCRYVRSQAPIADLPIILVTASRIETNDIVAGLNLGANDYVAKPFAPEELRARIDSVLRAKDLRETATRERTRLGALNRLGRALFEAGESVPRILHELLASLTGMVADGCAITLLPGELPPISAAIHRRDPRGVALGEIASFADPATYAFASDEEALGRLPPKYHDYIRRFGLRGLAILPFPIRNPILGVLTVTRDDGREPFESDDLATIETCIEYASLAVQNAVRFDAERAARAQLHAILESAPIGILVADPDGGLMLANPAASRLIAGIGQVAVLANVFDLGAWWSVEGVSIDRVSWTEKFLGPGRFEFVHVSDGHSRVLSIRTVLLSDNAGTVTAIEDISAQHSVAVERDRMAQFQQQMLGIVGHDLRNPLSAIITGSELVLEQSTDPAVQSRVRKILTSGQRMTGIVNQLLDITRARLGGGIPVTLARTRVAPIVEGVVDEIRIAYPNARVDLSLDDVDASCDADRLGQVVSNLISNAIKYGHPGRPVEVAVRASDELAAISITNALRDRPISSERLAELFQPFRRGDVSLHPEGLGLGLYIASEIIRAHHGRISATSSDAGTVFTVELPR
jgi:signal transduction histidine kinase/DNA-binding response OmpR family regulator